MQRPLIRTMTFQVSISTKFREKGWLRLLAQSLTRAPTRENSSNKTLTSSLQSFSSPSIVLKYLHRGTVLNVNQITHQTRSLQTSIPILGGEIMS